MVNDYSKYKLYRKYKTEDGVNYTPLDEYQALYESGDGKECDCGYRETSKPIKTDILKCSACVDVSRENVLILEDCKCGSQHIEIDYGTNFNEKNTDAANTMRSNIHLVVWNGGGSSVDLLTLDFILLEEAYLHCTIENTVSRPKLYDEEGNETELWYSYENGILYKPGRYRLEVSDFYIKKGEISGWFYLIARTNYVNIALTESWQFESNTFCPSTETIYDKTFSYKGLVGYNEKCEECYDIIAEYSYIEDFYPTIDVTGATPTIISNEPNKTYYIKFDNVNEVQRIDFLSYQNNDYGPKMFGITKLKRFNIPNLTSTSRMFEGCRTLDECDFSMIDTSNVTDMSYMFYMYNYGGSNDGYGYGDLKYLDLTSFNTSNVVNMSYMFGGNGLNRYVEINAAGWDLSKVENMDGFFNSSKYGTIILNATGWNTLNVKSYKEMFTYGLAVYTYIKIILGDVSQEQYQWWVDRLNEAHLTVNNDNIILEYNIV